MTFDCVQTVAREIIMLTLNPLIFFIFLKNNVYTEARTRRNRSRQIDLHFTYRPSCFENKKRKKEITKKKHSFLLAHSEMNFYININIISTLNAIINCDIIYEYYSSLSLFLSLSFSQSLFSAKFSVTYS